jgi:hypothetical protein
VLGAAMFIDEAAIDVYAEKDAETAAGECLLKLFQHVQPRMNTNER